MGYNNSLQHHGVLGMKWGVRKKRDSGGRVIGSVGKAVKKTKSVISGTRKMLRNEKADKLIKRNNFTFRERELQEKYMKMGLNKRDSVLEARNRARAEGFVRMAAGLSGVAAGSAVEKSLKMSEHNYNAGKMFSLAAASVAASYGVHKGLSKVIDAKEKRNINKYLNVK